MILTNSSTTPHGGRRLCSQPNLNPILSSEPWKSFTLTESRDRIGCETVLLMVRARGCTKTMYIGRCIFACETCQGERCKRSTQHPSITSRNIHRSTKLVVLVQMEDLPSPAATGRRPPGCVKLGPSDSPGPELL